MRSTYRDRCSCVTDSLDLQDVIDCSLKKSQNLVLIKLLLYSSKRFLNVIKCLLLQILSSESCASSEEHCADEEKAVKYFNNQRRKMGTLMPR